MHLLSRPIEILFLLLVWSTPLFGQTKNDTTAICPCNGEKRSTKDLQGDWGLTHYEGIMGDSIDPYRVLEKPFSMEEKLGISIKGDSLGFKTICNVCWLKNPEVVKKGRIKNTENISCTLKNCGKKSDAEIKYLGLLKNAKCYELIGNKMEIKTVNEDNKIKWMHFRRFRQ